jgi:hypothetical protein
MRIFTPEKPDETAYSSAPENDHDRAAWGGCDQLAFA